MTDQPSRPPAKAEPGSRWNDPKTPGLAVRYFDTRAGWYLYYRTKAGRQRNQRLGDFPAMTLTEARDRATEIRAAVAAGRDPAGEFAEGREAPDMAMLADWHIERHVKKRQRGRAEKESRRVWDRDVLPALKPATKVKAISKADIAGLHHSMRGRPVHANRVMAMLSKAFNLAEEWGWRDYGTNPVRVERYPEKKRRRYPEGTEPFRLMQALEAERAEAPVFVGLIEAVMLTGTRVGEIRTARLEWVKADGLHLPTSKTGEKIVALSDMAREVIAAIPRPKGCKWVIPNADGKAPLVNYHKRWLKVLDAAGIEGLHVHDLRRFFASAGLSAGESLSKVGELLGHASAQTTKIYAFLMQDAAKTAADGVAGRLREILTTAPDA